MNCVKQSLCCPWYAIRGKHVSMRFQDIVSSSNSTCQFVGDFNTIWRTLLISFSLPTAVYQEAVDIVDIVCPVNVVMLCIAFKQSRHNIRTDVHWKLIYLIKVSSKYRLRAICVPRSRESSKSRDSTQSRDSNQSRDSTQSHDFFKFNWIIFENWID